MDSNVHSNTWAFRTPIKPRPATTVLASTPATLDTEGPLLCDTTASLSGVCSPGESLASGRCTQDSQSPDCRFSSPKTDGRLLDYRRVDMPSSSPLYNTALPARLNAYQSPFQSSPSDMMRPKEPISVTPKANVAQRLQLGTNPLNLFESSSARSVESEGARVASPDSCWVNVSPSNKSVLMYTSGFMCRPGSAGCGVIYGPNPDQKIMFTIPVEDDFQRSPTNEGVSSPICKALVTHSSSVSPATPIPSKCPKEVISLSSSNGADRAALQAAIAALQANNGEWRKNGCTQLVIATDNKTVVSGVCDWLDEWRRNRWTTPKADESHAATALRRCSTPAYEKSAPPSMRANLIPNADLWRELDATLADLKAHNINVQFLHIPEEWNTQAIRTAQMAAVID